MRGPAVFTDHCKWSVNCKLSPFNVWAKFDFLWQGWSWRWKTHNRHRYGVDVCEAAKNRALYRWRVFVWERNAQVDLIFLPSFGTLTKYRCMSWEGSSSRMLNMG